MLICRSCGQRVKKGPHDCPGPFAQKVEIRTVESCTVVYLTENEARGRFERDLNETAKRRYEFGPYRDSYIEERWIGYISALNDISIVKN